MESGMSWSGVANWGKDNAWWLIPTGLGIYDAQQRGKEGQRARDLEDEGLDLARQQWSAREPFRQFALQGLQALGQPMQTGALFQDMGNPYAQTFASMHGRDLGAEMMPKLPAAAPSPAPSGVTPIGQANAGREMTDAERTMIAERQRNMDPSQRFRAPGVPFQPMLGGR